ncbi:MAG: hypothetical protein L0G59_12915, partial [Kocuria sp.]|nr:hypothetical protein [Kocuria sp.]
IEADHISANAITADKINAGAIDGKLITGARIRTSASGARVELNSEGLKAYRSNGAVVLNTDTSDGSIDMTGRLSQTIGDRTITVGGDYGGGPGIIWSDSNIYVYPPGVRYGNDPGNTSVMTTLVQGPGTNSGNSYLDLVERGDGFDLRAWKGTGSSRTDWRVDAEVGGMFRVGSSMQGAPSVYMKRGATGTGYLRARYEHPSLDGAYSMLSLEMNEIYLASYTEYDNLVGRLWMDNKSSELSAGDHDLTLRGKNIFLSASRDVSINPDGGIYMPSLPNDSGATEIGRINGRLHSVFSSRKYKLLEESIESTVESFEDKILSVDAKTWIDRTRADRIAEYQTAIATGNEPVEDIADIGGLERIPGVIAEDFDEAGLEVFVRYDDNGEPQSVAYDRIGPALIPIIRRLRDRVDALETKLGETA